MLLILKWQRKTNSRKVHTIKVQDRPETIGVKLSEHRAVHPGTKDAKKHGVAVVPQTTDKQKRWKKSTGEWKTTSEKTRAT